VHFTARSCSDDTDEARRVIEGLFDVLATIRSLPDPIPGTDTRVIKPLPETKEGRFYPAIRIFIDDPAEDDQIPRAMRIEHTIARES